MSISGRGQKPVPDLKATDFLVYEDEKPQQVVSVVREDAPISLGLLVDDSGSMKEKRDAVIHALSEFLKGSNSQNEAFLVHFNNNPYVDQQMTSDLSLLYKELERSKPYGPSSVYDTLIASVDYLARHGRNSRKVLLIVTDGEDNSSRSSLEILLQSIQSHKDITIYAIGVPNRNGFSSHARSALEKITAPGGGSLYYAKNPDELDKACKAVATMIRDEYTLTYQSAEGKTKPDNRKLRVEIQGGKNLEVHVH